MLKLRSSDLISLPLVLLKLMERAEEDGQRVGAVAGQVFSSFRAGRRELPANITLILIGRQ